METRQIPNFDGEQIVRVGRADMPLKDVAVGKEFVLDGSVYQTILNYTRFSSVPTLTSFRVGSSWYKRANESVTYALDGNSPFSRIKMNEQKYFGAADRVAVLEITLRGDAPAQSRSATAA